MRTAVLESLDNKFSRIAKLGSHNISLADKICAFCLAWLPLLQHYTGVFLEASICVVAVFLPYIIWKFIKQRADVNYSVILIVLPLIIFELYKLVDHGTNYIEIGRAIIFCTYLICAVCGCINIKYFIKYAYCIAMAASILIIVQYICFNFFNFHLQLVPVSLLLPEADIWIGGAETGMIGVTGAVLSFYRPSAFFLEPSHMFLYLFPLLFLLLLSPEKSKWKLISAIIITLGLVLSTSGMGICVAFGAWGLYFTCSNGKENIVSLKNLFRKRNILVIVVYLLVCFSIYSTVPLVEDSINRIFVGEEISSEMDGVVHIKGDKHTNEKGSTAIEGRTQVASMIIDDMKGKELIFGVADTTEGLNCNMSGYNATLYKYGYIGIILSYLFYVFSFLLLRYHNVWIAFIILLVSYFSAHTHGIFFMMYYVFILLEGWHSAKNPYNFKDIVKLVYLRKTEN